MRFRRVVKVEYREFDLLLAQDARTAAGDELIVGDPVDRRFHAILGEHASPYSFDHPLDATKGV